MRLLKNSNDENAVLAEILKDYEVDENTARRDLQDFLLELEKLGWKT